MADPSCRLFDAVELPIACHSLNVRKLKCSRTAGLQVAADWTWLMLCRNG